MKRPNFLTALLSMAAIGIDHGHKNLSVDYRRETGNEAPKNAPKKAKRNWFRKAVVVGNLIRECPGKRHAWFESAVGPIRKPI